MEVHKREGKRRVGSFICFSTYLLPSTHNTGTLSGLEYTCLKPTVIACCELKQLITHLILCKNSRYHTGSRRSDARLVSCGRIGAVLQQHLSDAYSTMDSRPVKRRHTTVYTSRLSLASVIDSQRETGAPARASFSRTYHYPSTSPTARRGPSSRFHVAASSRYELPRQLCHLAVLIRVAVGGQEVQHEVRARPGISSAREEDPRGAHSVRFALPLDAHQVTPSDDGGEGAEQGRTAVGSHAVGV